MMPSKPTSSARAYCSWYSLYSTCAFIGSKWVLGKPRRPESYLLRSSSVTYPLGCSENQKTSTCSVGRRSCSTIRASCLLCLVTGIPLSHSLSPEYVPSLGRCQSIRQTLCRQRHTAGATLPLPCLCGKALRAH